MSEQTANKLLLGGAYRIFFEEISKHIQASEPYLGEAGVLISEEIASELGARFHTIKGGAGFFGLKEVAELSGQIEQLLLKDKENKLLDRVTQSQEIFSKLEEASKTLPQPQPKKDP